MDVDIDFSDVDSWFDDEESTVLAKEREIAEEAVRYAKDNGNYKDHTGHLRKSNDSEVVEGEKVTLSLFGNEFDKKNVVDALKAIGEKGTMNMKEETLIANVTALDEEKTKALKSALGIEA